MMVSLHSRVYRVSAVLVLLLVHCAVGAEPLTGTRVTNFRDDGTLMIDGQAVFPIGIFPASYGQNIPHCADIGFNMVVGSGDVPDEFYDIAAREGLYAIGGHYSWATFHGVDDRMDLSQHEAAGFNLAFQYRDQSRREILETLELYGDHPATIGWYVYEEPKPNISEPLEHMYEIVKSHKPGQLVTGVTCDPVWFHHFYRTADVLMVDIYPYRMPGREQNEIRTYTTVRRAVEAMNGKPVWLMAQGGCMWKNIDNFPPLTAADYRNQAYLGLIAGADGYMLFSYATVEHFGKLEEEAASAQWEKIRTVVDELHTLSPILCNGRDSDAVRIDWQMPGGEGIPPLTRVLEHYGEHYILVTNLGSQSASARILGTNYGFPAAFMAQVFVGADGLSVSGQSGDIQHGVNVSPVGTRTAEFPVITIPSGQSGCFRIVRRPAVPAPQDQQ